MREIALDHVGVVTRDLAALAARYEGLGFTLTPLARQADRDTPIFRRLDAILIGWKKAGWTPPAADTPTDAV